MYIYLHPLYLIHMFHSYKLHKIRTRLCIYSTSHMYGVKKPHICTKKQAGVSNYSIYPPSPRPNCKKCILSGYCLSTTVVCNYVRSDII